MRRANEYKLQIVLDVRFRILPLTIPNKPTFLFAAAFVYEGSAITTTIVASNLGRAQMTFPARINMSKGSPVAACVRSSKPPTSFRPVSVYPA
ncbi:hypothetical protein LY76DRAFT_340862 [Colletotrichum caudatum]|nr:hypothetical protein LY76DRAFT_340862 [Colletotrichum caudatum]